MLSCAGTPFNLDAQRHANYTASEKFEGKKNAEDNNVRVIQNLAKVKTKKRSANALNKQIASQTNLDHTSTTYRDLSKFEYVETTLDLEQALENTGNMTSKSRRRPQEKL